MNGKGDSPRPVNLKVYRENFDAINWKRDASPIWEGSKMLSSWEGVNVERESHREFMCGMGYECKTEAEAYRLRGLLDL